MIWIDGYWEEEGTRREIIYPIQIIVLRPSYPDVNYGLDIVLGSQYSVLRH
jgi:hypothetical protein